MSRRSVGILNTSTLTTSLPVSASNAIARSEMPRCSTAVVSHTRPLAITGDDQPSPGTGDLPRDVLSSRSTRGAVPARRNALARSGPRNSGHCAVATTRLDHKQHDDEQESLHDGLPSEAWAKEDLAGWQREVKRRAFIQLAFGPDAAAVPGDDAVHDGEADAGAFEVSRHDAGAGTRRRVSPRSARRSRRRCRERSTRSRR